jgi:hypothetical protein
VTRSKAKRGDDQQVAQLSCWIGRDTMERLLTFVADHGTKQRDVVDRAISAFIDATEKGAASGNG